VSPSWNSTTGESREEACNRLYKKIVHDKAQGYLEDEPSEISTSSESVDDFRSRKYSLKKKRVRFAMESNGSVKCATRVYEDQSRPTMWWNDYQMDRIHSNCERVVIDCQSTEHERVEAMTSLYFTKKSACAKDVAAKEDLLLDVVEGYDARGLEAQIADVTESLSEKHVRSVLKAQRQMMVAGARPKVATKAIRRASKKSSSASRLLALKLAEYDTYEALRAVLSVWEK
jgi:hypothetical protein